MALGRLKVDELETSTQVVNIDDLASGGVSDGDKGDITVSDSGTVWSIDDGAVDTDALGGDITPAGKALLDDDDAAAQRTTLGLGTTDSPTFDNLTVTGLLTASHIHGTLAGDFYIHVKNTSGGTLDANTAVYATGSVGDTDRIEVAACDPTDPAKMPAIGLLKTSLPHNGEGDAVILGELRPTNTGSYGLGDELYVGAGGALVNTIPEPGTVQPVGSVARVQSVSGTIVVRIGAAMARAGFTGAYSDLTGKPTLGTAAGLNVGTAAGTVAAGDDDRFVPAGGTTGQVLRKSSGTDYDADWATPITTIDGLTDVTIALAADGEVLTYDSATGQWINSAPSGGGGTPGGTTGQLQWNSSGSFAGVGGSTVGATGDITLSLNGAASTPPLSLTGTWFTGGTSTTTKPQVLIEPAGTTSTAWSTSGTGLGVNAASGFSGNLLDLQVNGSTKALINEKGEIEATSRSYNFAAFKFLGHNTGITRWTQGHIGLIRDSILGLVFNGSDHIIGSSQSFAWSSGAAGFGGIDTTLFRDAAGILAQRNGTNAQTYRLYNTYTDASNYERAFLRWASNILEIGTEGAGTGSEQPVRITAATLKLPNLPTYADNAAATAGGLVAGDVYKTATGELRITV